jgi:hypothetical protein
VGDLASARATLRLATQAAEQIPGEMNRHFGLWRVATMQAKFGDVGPARVTFDQLIKVALSRGPAGRVELLASIAEAQARGGLRADANETLKKALASVPEIEPENLRNHGLFQIFLAELWSGDFEGALKLAERFEGKESMYRADFLQYIARDCDKAGPAQARRILARALELSKSVVFIYPRALAQQAIAQAQARNGDIPGAQQSARLIGEGDDEDSADQGFLQGLFGARRRAEMRRLRAEPCRWEVSPALLVIATEQAKAGDRDGAKATLREAGEMILQEQDGAGKSQRLRELVKAVVSIGELEAAKEAIKAFKNDDGNKALALAELARAQAKGGDKASARESLRDALAAARGIGRQQDVINDDPDRRKDEAFREFALAQAETGAIGDSLATIGSHGDDQWKSEILAQVAPIQARGGDIDGARKTAGAIPNDTYKAEAFLSISLIEAQSGKESDALAWAAKLASPHARALAILGVVEGKLVARRDSRPPSVKD